MKKHAFTAREDSLSHSRNWQWKVLFTLFCGKKAFRNAVLPEGKSQEPRITSSIPDSSSNASSPTPIPPPYKKKITLGSSCLFNVSEQHKPKRNWFLHSVSYRLSLKNANFQENVFLRGWWWCRSYVDFSSICSSTTEISCKKIIIVTPNFQTEFEEAHTETFTSPCIVTKEAVNQDVVLALSCWSKSSSLPLVLLVLQHYQQPTYLRTKQPELQIQTTNWSVHNSVWEINKFVCRKMLW